MLDKIKPRDHRMRHHFTEDLLTELGQKAWVLQRIIFNGEHLRECPQTQCKAVESKQFTQCH